MKAVYGVFGAIIACLFSFNVYSAETQAENSFSDGLNQVQRQVKAAPESGVPAAAAVPLPSARTGRDVTEKFQLTWDSCDRLLGEKEKMELGKYKVILVPGFLSNATTRPISIFGKSVQLGKYFGDQMKTLTELGVEYQLADIESEQTPSFNAVIIAKEIEASDKPVILIGHSKGGLDIMETLITRKRLLSKVKGIITIQTPYFGSPIADYILKGGMLEKLVSHLLKSMGGNLDSLVSLDTRTRGTYYQENAAAINEVIDTVPVITLGSWKNGVKYELDTVLKPLRDEMLKMGLQNDGQVPLSSAILPGTDHVKIEGVDHFVTVMGTGSILRYDRPRMTKTLLLMLISK